MPIKPAFPKLQHHLRRSSWWMKTGLDGGDWWLQLSIPHLKEIAIERGIPSYHIDSAERIRLVSEHRLLRVEFAGDGELVAGGCTVGITGASTPDKVVADVVGEDFCFPTTAVSLRH